MPTKSYGKFLNNIETVERLSGTYELIRTQRNSRGRAAFDHITRSAIIFLASAFEVYIEDIVNECCSQHILFAGDAKKLPHNARSAIGEYVKKDNNGISPIELCDEGWRNVYRRICTERTNKLNTPKKSQIKDLLNKLIGLSEQDIDRINSIDRIDVFISYRGDIAHRCRADEYVKIDRVNEEKQMINAVVKGVDRLIIAYFRTQYPNERLPWNDAY